MAWVDDVFLIAQGEQEGKSMLNNVVRHIAQNEVHIAHFKLRAWSASNPVAMTVDGKSIGGLEVLLVIAQSSHCRLPGSTDPVAR